MFAYATRFFALKPTLNTNMVQALLSGGLPGTLRRLLATSTLFSSSTTSASSVLRSTDQLLEVMDQPHFAQIAPGFDDLQPSCYSLFRTLASFYD